MFKKMKNNFKNYFSNGPKATFVSLLIIMFLVMILVSLKKTVIVVVDGKEMQINTLRSNVQRILSDNDIIVGPKDKIMPTVDSKVKNMDKIKIKRAVNVEVLVDGRDLKIKSAEDNVGKMLIAEKISLDKDDKTSISKDEVLQNEMKVVITRIESKIVKDVEFIDFATVIKQDDTIEEGNNKTIQEGKYGSKEITTEITYEDGKEISRKVMNEVITQKPVEKIVSAGTLGALSLSRGGKVLYTNSVKVKATAYSADYASTGKNPGDKGYGITATGTTARRNADGYSSIAVDPRVIPFGTKLYIPGYGYAIAEDTGGAIKGNIIDVFFNMESEAINWGVKWLTVYILK